MNYQNILVENKDGILLLTINREKAYNALNKGTFSEIKDVFENYYKQIDGLKGVVITGAGEKAFVAGADIKEFLDLTPEKSALLSKTGQDIFFLIENFHRPVIAAINGFALGGGCELAMACHMRIAGEKAKFGQPEVNLGIIPGYGATQRLTQLVGKAKSMELHMTGDMIGAEEAHRLGLVNYTVAKGEEVNKAIELIEKIATKAPIAIANVIQCINAHYNKEIEGFANETSQFANCAKSKDFFEGAAAFIEKRKPNFQGH